MRKFESYLKGKFPSRISFMDYNSRFNHNSEYRMGFRSSLALMRNADPKDYTFRFSQMTEDEWEMFRNGTNIVDHGIELRISSSKL